MPDRDVGALEQAVDHLAQADTPPCWGTRFSTAKPQRPVPRPDEVPARHACRGKRSRWFSRSGVRTGQDRVGFASPTLGSIAASNASTRRSSIRLAGRRAVQDLSRQVPRQARRPLGRARPGTRSQCAGRIALW